MKCRKCKHENRERAIFCNECGKRLEFLCPDCGTANRPGSRFCDECGQKLEDIQKTGAHPPVAESERKFVSVLFSDLSGYTAMSEKRDPEEVKEITSGIFGDITRIIDKYEGFLVKFAGDAVMALFGVPESFDNNLLLG